MGADDIPQSSRGKVASLAAQIVRSPATWLFTAVWLASLLALVMTGNDPTFAVVVGAVYLLFSALTAVITEPAPALPAAPADRSRLWLQVGLTLLFIVLTAWNGLVFHAVVAPDAAIPLWSPFVAWLQRLGGQ